VSGGDDVTVVWLAPDPAPVGAPGASGVPSERDDAARALAEWGRARGLRILSATAGARSGPLTIDFTIADRVEKELDRAREATAALAADVAAPALARAETLLRDHPELPQAAWLRAEVHRSWAARWSRVEPRDDQRAQLAWQEADALDGGRAAGIGEVAFPARPRSATTLTVSGASSQKVIARLDGAEIAGTASADGVTTYALDVPAAEHHLVISVDGDVAFASWVAIAPTNAGSPRPTIPIHVGDDGACSASSLDRVTRATDGSVHAGGVTCDHWVAAVPAERRGAVLVARCERSACGPFLEWRSESAFGTQSSPPLVAHHGPWPAWATWTAIGVGALAATTIALVASGVLESHPTEQRFVAGGVRVE
jgi:hypothetical protein